MSVHGVYMVIISGAKSKLITSVTAEVCDCFESLVKQLVANESLEGLLGSFQGKIAKNFEEKKWTQWKDKTTMDALQDNALQKREIKRDDNAQYSRRLRMHIHGVDTDKSVGKSVFDTDSKEKFRLVIARIK